MQPADPLIGTEIGSYRVERKLAQGGMGSVYLGVQPAIGSRVAIKVLSERCAEDPGLVERFFSEARAVNLIRHEAIVSVLDMAALPDGRPYLVMEYIDGQTLGHIGRRVQLPLGGVARAIGEALSALGAAHDIGIIHRDLKPDNILITAKGHAKLLDFGIAKLARGLAHEHAPRTYTDAFMGTPAYMSPEQIAQPNAVDARADLYAMGAVLYEAVTGRPPFTGTTFELLRAHVDQAPVPPRSLRPDLPAPYEEVILMALAKHPSHRFASATAMGNALASAAAQLMPAQQTSLQLIDDAPVVPPPVHAPSVVAPSAHAPPPSTIPAPRSRRSWAIPAAIALAVGAIAVAVAMRGGHETPPPPPPPPLVVVDPAHFDIHAFLPLAIAHARAVASDAALVEIQLFPLIGHGRIDLTKAGAIENRVVFVSKTAKPCTTVIAITPTGPHLSRVDEGCQRTPVRPPRCRLGDLVEATMASYLDGVFDSVPAMGGMSGTTVRYVAGKTQPRWEFSGFAGPDEADDDCAGLQ